MSNADLGTRWVLLAALGGLIVGGLLAYWRKRRAKESDGERDAGPK